MLLERIAFFLQKAKEKRLIVALVWLINENQHVNLSILKPILVLGSKPILKWMSLVSGRLKRIYPF
jgi:hypothetical protein